jgi:hypothetical protein
MYKIILLIITIFITIEVNAATVAPSDGSNDYSAINASVWSAYPGIDGRENLNSAGEACQYLKGEANTNPASPYYDEDYEYGCLWFSSDDLINLTNCNTVYFSTTGNAQWYMVRGWVGVGVDPDLCSDPGPNPSSIYDGLIIDNFFVRFSTNSVAGNNCNSTTEGYGVGWKNFVGTYQGYCDLSCDKQTYSQVVGVNDFISTGAYQPETDCNPSSTGWICEHMNEYYYMEYVDPELVTPTYRYIDQNISLDNRQKCKVENDYLALTAPYPAPQPQDVFSFTMSTIIVDEDRSCTAGGNMKNKYLEPEPVQSCLKYIDTDTNRHKNLMGCIGNEIEGPCSHSSIPSSSSSSSSSSSTSTSSSSSTSTSSGGTSTSSSTSSGGTSTSSSTSSGGTSTSSSSSSSSGGDATASGECDQAPSCSGDPVYCAILYQQWYDMCHFEDSTLPDVSGPEFQPDETEVQVDTIIENTILTQTSEYAAVCPAANSVELMGHSIVFSYEMLCDVAEQLNPILRVLTVILCFYIVGSYLRGD